MLAKLKLLLKDTTIYGASTILASGLNYLLVPFYANLLTLEENGIQSIIYSSITFASVIYTFGLESAYLKFAADKKVLEKRQLEESTKETTVVTNKVFSPSLSGSNENHPKWGESIFSTPFIGLFSSSLCFTVFIFIFSSRIAEVLGLSGAESGYVQFAAVILLIDTMSTLPLAWLRSERKAGIFSSIKLVNVLVTIAVSLWLVVVEDLGVRGVFYGNIAGSIISLGLASSYTIKFSAFVPLRFSKNLFRQMMRYGLPLVPNSIAMMLIDFVDRLILIRIPQETIQEIYGQQISPEALVGIYGRVYSLAVLAQLLVRMFRFAWQPFYLQQAAEPDAKALFSKVLTIATVFITTFTLFASFFVPLVIQIHFFGKFYILPPAFWIGLSVLPILYLSYVFDVISSILFAGLLIEKKTEFLPVITLIGAAVTAILCFALIPLPNKWGAMTGAALATTAGSLAMAVGAYFFSQKIYPNNFEWGKILLSLFSALFIFIFSSYLSLLMNSWIVNSVSFSIYTGLILYFFRVEAKQVFYRVKGKKA
ncbi:MAG: oligosaccharide flippase family protein [Chloroherpetonaceae bacterium]|nr:oligosaccharide flippase family protein [Chloroherpetonaceae bacterium]